MNASRYARLQSSQIWCCEATWPSLIAGDWKRPSQCCTSCRCGHDTATTSTMAVVVVVAEVEQEHDFHLNDKCVPTKISKDEKSKARRLGNQIALGFSVKYSLFSDQAQHVHAVLVAIPLWFWGLPSLKLTFSPPKIDGWKMIFFWGWPILTDERWFQGGYQNSLLNHQDHQIFLSEKTGRTSERIILG